MKVFVSKDAYPSLNAFVVSRRDPKADRDPTELPNRGERVQMDDREIVVEAARFAGDVGFNYWPELLIFARTPPP